MLKLSRKFQLKVIKRVSLETIKVYGDIEIGKDYSEIDLNNVLNKLYETEFLKMLKLI